MPRTSCTAVSSSSLTKLDEDLIYLEGHAEHLLDGLLWLKKKHTIFRPMMDKQLRTWRGSGKQWPGFITIHMTLFFSCALDIANLGLDDDERTPSIAKIVNKLKKNITVRQELRRRYAVTVFPVIDEEQKDQAHMAIIHDLEQQWAAEWEARFDEEYEQLLSLWKKLKGSRPLKAFKEIRDKLAAHTDLVYVDGVYKPLLDIGTLGLTWGDTTMTIHQMKKIIELINRLVRRAGFDWDSLEEQNYQAATAFWRELPETPMPEDEIVPGYEALIKIPFKEPRKPK